MSLATNCRRRVTVNTFPISYVRLLVHPSMCPPDEGWQFLTRGVCADTVHVCIIYYGRYNSLCIVLALILYTWTCVIKDLIPYTFSSRLNKARARVCNVGDNYYYKMARVLYDSAFIDSVYTNLTLFSIYDLLTECDSSSVA